MQAHNWPGNIRELRNVIERSVLMAHGSVLLPEHLPLEQLGSAPGREKPAAPLPEYTPKL